MSATIYGTVSPPTPVRFVCEVFLGCAILTRKYTEVFVLGNQKILVNQKLLVKSLYTYRHVAPKSGKTDGNPESSPAVIKAQEVLFSIPVTLKLTKVLNIPL